MKHYTTGTSSRARSLRRNATDAELLLWRKLRENFPDAKFRRQSPIGPYFADFLSHRHTLIIEVDGGQHVHNAEQDARRNAFLRSQGFTVIRFWNHQVVQDTDGVLDTIASRVNDHASHALTGQNERRHP
ncbi:MAG: DUF559 domain-containing protein [Pontixanthobacter sp.]